MYFLKKNPFFLSKTILMPWLGTESSKECLHVSLICKCSLETLFLWRSKAHFFEENAILISHSAIHVVSFCDFCCSSSNITFISPTKPWNTLFADAGNQNKDLFSIRYNWRKINQIWWSWKTWNYEQSWLLGTPVSILTPTCFSGAKPCGILDSGYG